MRVLKRGPPLPAPDDGPGPRQAQALTRAAAPTRRAPATGRSHQSLAGPSAAAAAVAWRAGPARRQRARSPPKRGAALPPVEPVGRRFLGVIRAGRCWPRLTGWGRSWPRPATGKTLLFYPIGNLPYFWQLGLNIVVGQAGILDLGYVGLLSLSVGTRWALLGVNVGPSTSGSSFRPRWRCAPCPGLVPRHPCPLPPPRRLPGHRHLWVSARSSGSRPPTPAGTGGPRGIAGIPHPPRNIGNLDALHLRRARPPARTTTLVLGLIVVVIFVARRLERSPRRAGVGPPSAEGRGRRRPDGGADVPVSSCGRSPWGARSEAPREVMFRRQEHRHHSRQLPAAAVDPRALGPSSSGASGKPARRDPGRVSRGLAARAISRGFCRFTGCSSSAPPPRDHE